MKTIAICDKEYNIECNAFTCIQYRKVFNRGIFEDIQVLKDYLVTQTVTSIQLKEENPKMSEVELAGKLSDIMMSKLDGFIEAVTRIAYILIYSANQNIEDYEAFLKSIKAFKIDDDWIVEVTEFAVDAFVDSELSKELEKLSSGDDEKELFPEHCFIATCLRAGLTVNDLKILTYVDVMKILISFIPKKKSNTKKATQADIDRFLR